MSASGTFYWLDYETWGANPAVDRPAQFAGLRTDAELREQGEPLLLYCRPPRDYLPHPGACLVHRIAPQTADELGLPEPVFIARILEELEQPGTCGVGFNSIRFDDEVTRYTLFRNFHDPYAREWQHGNSRWDLIDVLRMARLLRPEGLQWPDRDGRPSFKLGELTRANGIEHSGAHDALADVRATLELARRLRAAQPRLWDYALKARDKRWVLGELDLRNHTPLLHVSSRFPAERGSAALVMPLLAHPDNRNSVIVCNLGLDPAPLLELDAASLRRYLYTRTEDLPEGMGRIPLKEIKANKSPMLAPLSMLTPGVEARCGIDRAACAANRERLLAAPGLIAKIREVFVPERGAGTAIDPELDLYGAFLGNADRLLADRVRRSDPAALADTGLQFADRRLPELLFRYRARNFPETLSAEESVRWDEHRHARLHGPADKSRLNLDGFRAELRRLRDERSAEPAALELLGRVSAWGESIAA